MKRSQQISLRLVPIVSAAFLAACETPQRQACVDQNGRVVAEANCANQPPNGASGSWNARSSGGFYHWYWYRGSGSPIIGSRAPSGGHFSAPASSATIRGGFGATAAGHVSGGS